MSDAPREEGKDLMLWSFEQGGWNRGVWHEGRWVDYLALSVELQPIYWDNVLPDPPEDMLQMVVSNGVLTYRPAFR
jgi:hypothetical protein